ncbi:MAG: fasciclin domain-containing protein [Armatimonadota bacterium]
MNRRKSLLSIVLVLSMLLVPLTPVLAEGNTIVDIALADGRFTTLVAALKAANLVDTLNGAGPFTVFAPTDDAFTKLPEGTVASLLADIPTLTNILLYHVVSAEVLAADVVALSDATTVLGKPVAILVVNGKVYVNNAQVIITDIKASNGVIHVIDTVILPPMDYRVVAGDYLAMIAAQKLGQSTRYMEIVLLTNALARTDSSYTMVADPNLIYTGQKLALPGYVGDKAVTAPVETVEEETAVAPAAGTIVDLAVADGRFKTLVAALTATNLVDTLNGAGPFTVFAPTDDAFAKLPEGTVAALLADIPTLTNILLYHVVGAEVMAADVVKLADATTVLGKPVAIQVIGGKVYVNGAQVIITDIKASNGVIHVIDTVILPPLDYTVVAGDFLSTIANSKLGSSPRYMEIVLLTNALARTDTSNRHIEDANLIITGQKLALPGN